MSARPTRSPSAEELFGEIPAGPPVAQVTAPAASRASARRLTLEDRVELPRLYLSWHSPALFAHGDAELDLAADILANGRTSRLYRRLIHDRRLASDVTAAQSSRDVGGIFQVIATAAPGCSLDELEAAIGEELQQFAADGPDDAMSSAAARRPRRRSCIGCSHSADSAARRIS